MQAVRFPGKEDVRVEEVEEPAPGPGEVKLRNAYAGICGSDLHVFYSPEASGLDFSRPHPVTGSTPPQILGHEFAGTVAADMLHKLPEAVDLRLGALVEPMAVARHAVSQSGVEGLQIRQR